MPDNFEEAGRPSMPRSFRHFRPGDHSGVHTVVVGNPDKMRGAGDLPVRTYVEALYGRTHYVVPKGKTFRETYREILSEFRRNFKWYPNIVINAMAGVASVFKHPVHTAVDTRRYNPANVSHIAESLVKGKRL